MKAGDDVGLLRDYAENGSDLSFSALVGRHFNLVYTTALRIANGDAALAQDVAQNVFTDFARKAKRLPPDLFLGGWLYKHTCFIAANAIRTERRRQTRERQAFEMNFANDESDPIWSGVGPILDKAMSRLAARDRDALVLRFFEQRSFRSVGGALGISEEAARKRVDRALEKLRGFFAQHGLSFSAAVLTSALDAHAGAAAPVGLASIVATAAFSEAAKSGGAGLSLIKLMTITKAKIALAAIAAGLTAAIIVQSQNNSRLQRENRTLRQRAAQLTELQAENEQLNKIQPAATPELKPDQFRELMRLRGEVGVLKDQLQQAKKAQTAQAIASHEPVSAPEDPAEDQRQIAIAKMGNAKQWMLAFLMYASDHQQACPANFDQATAYWPKDATETNPPTNEFQVVYQGAFNDITNPAQTIVLQETDPVQGPDGGWFKAYGFADGHAEYHKSADGNFAPWESQRMQLPPAQ
ncbi:MAG TPA: sigma-70 family RNA polymerase sigma factor [Verrucomicrobiae bacterium]|nr:sigma-70 family RNA polymerase sigma factor [Verrucomicrobiae bacterium]